MQAAIFAAALALLAAPAAANTLIDNMNGIQIGSDGKVERFRALLIGEDGRVRALAEAQRLLLASGITAAADMGTSVDDWRTMRRAGDADRLQVRIISYAAGLRR
jgi:predicted amidohydrolase YtcJ